MQGSRVGPRYVNLSAPSALELEVQYIDTGLEGSSGYYITGTASGFPEEAVYLLLHVGGLPYFFNEGDEIRIQVPSPSQPTTEVVSLSYITENGPGRGNIQKVRIIPVEPEPEYVQPIQLSSSFVLSRSRVVPTSGGWYTLEVMAQPGDPHYDAVSINWLQSNGNTNPPQPAESGTGPTIRRPDEGTTRVWRFAAASFSGDHGHERQINQRWSTCAIAYKTVVGKNAQGGDIVSALGPISQIFSWNAPVSTGTPADITSVSLSGTPQVGQTLQASVVSIGDPSPTVTIQWTLAGAAISGQTGTTLLLTSPMVGQEVGFTATASNNVGGVAYSDTVNSTIMSVVAAPLVTPPTATLNDWAIVGESVEGSQRTLYLCTTGSGAYAADCTKMWWTDWTSTEQAFPFECVLDGTVPSGTHAGRRRWKMTGITNGSVTSYHLSNPGTTTGQIGIMVQMVENGPRSAFPLTTQRRTWTYAGNPPVDDSDLPTPNVTVSNAAALTAAMNAVVANTSSTYRIGLNKGNYGPWTAPANYNKGTTKVVLQATASADKPLDFPTFEGVKVQNARNLHMERFRTINKSREANTGFINSGTLSGGLYANFSRDCSFKDFYSECFFYGIEATSIQRCTFEYFTIRGFGNDAIRHYSTVANPNVDCIFRRFTITPHVPVSDSANTWQNLGTVWASYTHERTSSIDPRRNDSDGWQETSYPKPEEPYGPAYPTITGAAIYSITNRGAVTMKDKNGKNFVVLRSTLYARHADGLQTNGPIAGLIVEDFSIMCWNGYMHGLLLLNESGVNPNAMNTGIRVRRGIITCAAVHALQISRSNDTRFEQIIIRQYPTRTWSTGPGTSKGSGYMLPCISNQGQTSTGKEGGTPIASEANILKVTNCVQPASVPKQWVASRAEVTGLQSSNTAVPTGWASTLVAQGKIGFLGWKN